LRSGPSWPRSEERLTRFAKCQVVSQTNGQGRAKKEISEKNNKGVDKDGPKKVATEIPEGRNSIREGESS